MVGGWLVLLMQRFGGMIEVNLSETVIDAFSTNACSSHKSSSNYLTKGVEETEALFALNKCNKMGISCMSPAPAQ